METQTLGVILTVVGLVFSVIGSINGFLLLLFRTEIKHLRELIQLEKESRKNCETRCGEHRKNIWNKIND